MSAVRPSLMRAVRVAQFGGPEVLKVETSVPVPEPADGQVLVEVKASGINPVDTYIRSGIYAIKPDLPYTPGVDFCGIVKALGGAVTRFNVLVEVKASGINPVDTYIRTGTHSIKPSLPYIPGADVAGSVKTVGAAVTKFKPGDRVYAVRTVTGGYAEYAIADQNFMGHLDTSLTFEEGAGIGIPVYTAYRAVITKGKAEAGQSILVHGASGAVGLACVQIAKARGLTVYGTAGTQEGIDLVLKQGATACFNHREDGYSDKIMAATDGSGPDIIIEMLANVNLDRDLQLINKYGTIVIVGNRGTIEINPRVSMQKECVIVGCMLGHTSTVIGSRGPSEVNARGIMQKESSTTGFSLMFTPPAEFMKMHEAIAEGMIAGWVKPHIGKEYILEEAPIAHDEVINSGKSLGKRIFKL